MNDNYKLAFDKEMDNKNVDGITRVSNAMFAMSRAMLKDAPMWMRFNFILNNVGNHESKDVNWDEVNKILSDNVNQYDFNAYDKINSVKELCDARGNCIATSMDLGAWRKETCKECEEVFYMSNGEVQFFKEKEFQLPKRCKCCREKKNKPIKESASKGKISIQHNSNETTKAYCGETAMQIAMKKAGLAV